MKPTIKDVAQLAGVSFKTVSRVINNEGVVGEKLKEKVFAAIKELNYHPNLSARGLRGGASSLGFIYDNPNSNYLIAMQNGMLKACLGEGFELVIRPCDSNAKTLPEQIIEMVDRSRVGGVLLTPPISENPAVINKLIENEVAVARIVSGAEEPEDAKLSPCIYVNDRRAAYEITRHLIELGHRNIAFFAGNAKHKSTTERHEGFLQAMREFDLKIDPKRVLEGEFTFDSGVQRASSLFQSQSPLSPASAIFACNDEIAAGALFAARQAQIQVPEDLSIAGFEDSPFSRQTWPKLTTAAQPAERIAAQATQLLIGKIRCKNADKLPNSETFVPNLVIRESTGKFTQ